MLVALTYASTPISKTLFIDLGLVNVSKVVTSDFVNIHNPGRLLLSNGYILGFFAVFTIESECVEFDLNGYSSKIPFYKSYYYESKIRYENGQSILFVSILYFLRILNKFRNILYNR